MNCTIQIKCFVNVLWIFHFPQVSPLSITTRQVYTHVHKCPIHLAWCLLLGMFLDSGGGGGGLDFYLWLNVALSQPLHHSTQCRSNLSDFACHCFQEIELVFKPHPLHEHQVLRPESMRYLKTSAVATIDHLGKYLSMRVALDARGTRT